MINVVKVTSTTHFSFSDRVEHFERILGIFRGILVSAKYKRV